MRADARYYFFHIPKTAGSTLAFRLLPKFFQAGEICPHMTFDALLAVPPEVRARYRLFHGHFNNQLENYVGGELRVLTVLRHPFERAISQYRYILSSPAHPLHAAVAAVPDFGAYIRDRLLFAPNSLTLALGSFFDPAEVLRRAAWRGQVPGSFDRIFDEETFNTAARRRHVEAAKAVLDRCMLVGLQEDMLRTAALVHAHFGAPFEGTVAEINRSTTPPLARSDLPAGVLADLTRLHAHDLEVYAHGKALFERQAATADKAEAAAAPVVIRAPDPPLPPRLYYMNLPWSGDIDLASQLLHGYFRPSEVCPAWNYDGLLALPTEARPAYAAYHGHFFWPLGDFVGGDLAPVLFLTDPAARALQQYRERLADPAHKLHARIRAKSGLGAFVRDPIAFTPNVLTLSLARRFAPRGMARLQAQAVRAGISVNEALGEYVAAHPANRWDLARAKRRLAQCAFIGFAADFQASLAALGRLLDWPDIADALRPELHARYAETPMISAADRAAVTAVNTLDAELYAFARSISGGPAPETRAPVGGTLARLLDRSGGVLRAAFRRPSDEYRRRR
jgi:hypothetical protein